MIKTINIQGNDEISLLKMKSHLMNIVNTALNNIKEYEIISTSLWFYVFPCMKVGYSKFVSPRVL